MENSDEYAKTNPLVPQLKIGDYVDYWMTFPFQEEIVWSVGSKQYLYRTEPVNGYAGQRVKRGPDMVCDIVKENDGSVIVWLDVIIDIDNTRKGEPVLRKIPVHYIVGIVDRV